MSAEHDPRQIGAADLEWYETGHINSTLILTELARIDRRQGRQIAIYCQLPDYFKLTYSAGTPLWAWIGGRHRDARVISQILHGFHGGGGAEVSRRQAFLRARLRSYMREGAPDWQLGITAHALGDAFAHTYRDDDGERHAYGYPLGHGLDFICGVKPDHISQHPELYLDYCRALYWALCGEDARDSIEFAGFEGGFRATLSHPRFQEASRAGQEAMVTDYIVERSRDDTTHADFRTAMDALDYDEVIGLLRSFAVDLEGWEPDGQFRHRPA
ncbi:hypothetical protein [Palleronia caenipelagi]|uniref:Uncharacterized protein n=1 Tax=Palleronia caenipelagi TaxID=2489174 RepID=A0A547PQ52_9RHOB|nr:hypothetical protein [Palleronia caenipelagi]TRD16255.1 hypothetical protein FEV53_14490 [Palleronia caenipelagi]